ncbi:nitroreductase [Streptomyces sp. NPDC046909]|uniref:nitroreductase n=1 Tax=Streptomyces sp. NPDC046909 TaxID=3155617 RepID=UPI0034048306
MSANVDEIGIAAPAGYRELRAIMEARHSCRAFTADEVPRETIVRVLETAQLTASWCNTQPWQVTVLSGERRRAFADRLYAHAESGAGEAYDLDTPEYRGISLVRRREAGWGLYEAVGITRGDREASLDQALRNFRFFDAPHIAIITSDRALGTYGVLDCGAYVASFLAAATALGLATIAQAAAVHHGDVVREHLAIPDDRLLVCGIAFGYEDRDHPANAFRTSRAPVTDAVTFLD